MKQYTNVQNRLCRGWNTWNVSSVLSWVHLPEGLAINMGLKASSARAHLREVLIGREEVRVDAHAHDGSYSSLTLKYGNTHLRVETGTDDDDLVILATSLEEEVKPSVLIVEGGILWNRPGYVERLDDTMTGHFDGYSIEVYSVGTIEERPSVQAMGPYLPLALSNEAGVSTGRRRSLDDIKAIIASRKNEHDARKAEYGTSADTYDALQTCTAFNTFYDPIYRRAITPVSRNWSLGGGGYVLCCWDTFFAAMIAAVDNKDLAYANTVEVLNEKTPAGQVTNCSMGSGRKCYDRSQPPVGAATVKLLYEKFGERWLLEKTFDDLLGWNRWWTPRRFMDGYMCWGSDPFESVVGDPADFVQPNTLQGAKYESGLDNSPMYDDMPFDTETHLMPLADVGLMGLYAADCDALADIAREIDRPEEKELRERYDAVAAKLKTLWHEETGLFLNRRLDTGEFSFRLSPTLFYPLLAKVATPEQAERMVREHLLNEEEFWGKWVVPSAARNDPAFVDDYYWRGRIWPPLNWLVYLCLRNYDFPEVRKIFAEKCENLLLKEWLDKHHVHENFNADTGEGCGSRSYEFYHWGGLLGLIPLMERGLA